MSILEALPEDLAFDAIRLEGSALSSDVLGAMTSAEIERTIEGAPTLTVTLRDPQKSLLRSGIFDTAVTVQVDRYSFQLAQVRKSGFDLNLTFEDLVVASLRSHTAPRKAAAGTTTRAEFIKSLVAEEPWIGYVTHGTADRTRVELARGTVDPAATKSDEAPEDSWAAIGRLADEVKWRRFVPAPGELWYVSEDWLAAQPVAYVLDEDGPGVESIDFDFDSGKPVASMSATVRAGRWTIPPGALVSVVNLGPADGDWLVESIRRPLTSLHATVALSKAVPALPEPAAPAVSASEPAAAGEGAPSSGGASVDTGAVSSGGWAWPVRGRISSGFGTRHGRLHAGIDIAVGVGTPVGASKAGTVTFAGSAGGYGNVVYINHGGTFTRYGHLSRIDVRRGQQVSKGTRVGLSGGRKGAPGAGNSQGPHVHFEIRPGDHPANPRNFLP